MIINCDTPIESLIDVNKIIEKVEEYEDIVKTINNKLTEVITEEQKRGLSSTAFKLDDSPLIYDKSENIMQSIDELNLELSTWKNNIIDIATAKRKEEIETLRYKVLLKVQELSSDLNNLRLKNTFSKDTTFLKQEQELEKNFRYYKEKYDELLILR